MKILVSVPENHSEKELKTFYEGVKQLKKLGHNILEVKQDSKKTKDSHTKTFAQMDKYVKDTDILLADVSNADAKVGFEIARALDEKKVVIALQDEKSKNEFQVIHGNQTKQVVQKIYSSKNIIETVQTAIKEASSRMDSKFILIISPEMDRYLGWASKVKRTHKAQVVRAALEAMMKKDKEYREYVQGE